MRLMVIARRRHSERTESAGHVAPSSAAQPHRPLTLLAREALLSVRDVGSGLCSFVSTLNKVECAISGGRRIGAHARGLPKDRKSRALLGCRCMFPQDERHNEERRGRGSQGNRRWWTSWRFVHRPVDLNAGTPTLSDALHSLVIEKKIRPMALCAGLFTGLCYLFFSSDGEFVFRRCI